MPLIKRSEDFSLWLNILKKTDGYGLREKLTQYLIREGSLI